MNASQVIAQPLFLLVLSVAFISGCKPAPLPNSPKAENLETQRAAEQKYKPNWLTNYKAAAAEAKASNKLLLLAFGSSDSCPSCQLLEEKVFSTKEFVDYANKNFVLVQVDFPLKTALPADLEKQNTELQHKYNVEDWPTIILTKPDGTPVISELKIMFTPEAFISEITAKLPKTTPAQMPASRSASTVSLSPLRTSALQNLWIEDYELARKRAKAENKIILMDFTGSDFCPPCIALERNVFSTPEFKAYAATHLILLEIDFPHEKPQSAALKEQNLSLGLKYAEHDGVINFPTLLLMNPKGKIIGKLDDPFKYIEEGPSSMIKDLERFKP